MNKYKLYLISLFLTISIKICYAQEYQVNYKFLYSLDRPKTIQLKLTNTGKVTILYQFQDFHYSIRNKSQSPSGESNGLSKVFGGIYTDLPPGVATSDLKLKNEELKATPRSNIVIDSPIIEAAKYGDKLEMEIWFRCVILGESVIKTRKIAVILEIKNSSVTDKNDPVINVIEVLHDKLE